MKWKRGPIFDPGFYWIKWNDHPEIKLCEFFCINKEHCWIEWMGTESVMSGNGTENYWFIGPLEIPCFLEGESHDWASGKL